MAQLSSLFFLLPQSKTKILRIKIITNDKKNTFNQYEHWGKRDG